MEEVRKKILAGLGKSLVRSKQAINEAIEAGEKVVDKASREARIKEIAQELGTRLIFSEEKVKLPEECEELLKEAKTLLG